MYIRVTGACETGVTVKAVAGEGVQAAVGGVVDDIAAMTL